MLALEGSSTLDRTLTNHLGEFVLEPDVAEDLRLSVGLAEIGTFTLQTPRYEERGPTVGDDVRALGAAGRGKRKGARQR